MRKVILSLFVGCCFLLQNCGHSVKPSVNISDNTKQYYTAQDFIAVLKIDAHLHINTIGKNFIEQAVKDNFKLIAINVEDSTDSPPIPFQQKVIIQQIKSFPGEIAYATTFSIYNFNDSNWADSTIAYLKNSFAFGAIAVKFYKTIGMSLKDKNGKIVMIDNPVFDTVINFIIKNNIPVLGHLGEPKNCWLPVNKMTVNGDKEYYGRHPEYHMYLHPELPNYEAQINARDKMLQKHPDLKFIGAHLGSLEWSVDELAKRLDNFPNMAVDMAARICHLQFQSLKNRQKVRDFMIKYQDRILYATDMDDNTKDAHATRLKDWEFFTTDEIMVVKDFDGSFKGLKLPVGVIDKIYRMNAEKWYPGIKDVVIKS